jgi:hypothetical protein
MICERKLGGASGGLEQLSQTKVPGCLILYTGGRSALAGKLTLR